MPRCNQVALPEVILIKGRLHLTVLPQTWDRPKTRGECEPWSQDERLSYEMTGESARCYGFRPCPFVSCKHHLLIDVAHPGRLVKTSPFDDQSDADGSVVAGVLMSQAQTCSLDVADEGESAPRAIGRLVNTSRQMVERIIDRSVAKAQRKHGASHGARQEYPWRRS
jgi:hypothetical protein